MAACSLHGCSFITCWCSRHLSPSGCLLLRQQFSVLGAAPGQRHTGRQMEAVTVGAERLFTTAEPLIQHSLGLHAGLHQHRCQYCCFSTGLLGGFFSAA